MVAHWLAPWAGTRTIGQVANDREGVTNLLNRDIGRTLAYSATTAVGSPALSC